MEALTAFADGLPPLMHLQAWGIAALALTLAFLWLGSLVRSSRRTRREETRWAEERRRAERAEDGVAMAEQRLRQLVEERETLRDEMRADRQAHGARLAEAGEESAALRACIAGMEADAAAQDRRIEELRSIRQEMTDRFAALSEEALKAQGARQHEVSEASLKALLGPMKAGVDKFQEELRAAHGLAQRERVTLAEQIRGLSEQTNAVNDQAAALTNALRGDKQKQGAWGEAQLQRLLEAAHLQEGVHFRTQVSERTEDGTLLRPDVVIDMPNDRPLVIDSKVSLIAYEQAVNAVEDGARTLATKAHVTAIRAHVDGLSGKSYHRLARDGVDYVVMFVPIEGALAAAVEAQPDLSAWALERGVALATPLTLMALLRTVEHVWAVDARQKNAMEIADRAGRLYDKVAGFVEDAHRMGRALDTARKAHDDAMTKLSGRGGVLSQTDMLKQLGAKASKQIEAEFEGERPVDTPSRPGIEAAG